MAQVSNKQKAIEIINQLPENITLYEIAYKLDLEDRFAKAQKDSDEGNLYSQAIVEERLKSWFD